MSKGVNRIIKGAYPSDWNAIARRVKKKAGWMCERCGSLHNVVNHYVLTVHHLDGDKSNCEAWNLAALCQCCHLSIQGRVNPFQDYMLKEEMSEWFKPHYKGMLKALESGTWPTPPG